MVDAALSARNRRRTVAAGTGVLAAGLLVVAGGAAVLLPDGETGSKPGAHAAVRSGSPSPAASTAVAPSVAGDGDPDAMPEVAAYFQVKDPGGETVRHVTDVRRSGAFLRVYTDLDEGDENTDAAITLCEWAAEYLERYDGEGEPIVFVHAEESGNGHVVLANKQSADDDCRVGETR